MDIEVRGLNFGYVIEKKILYKFVILGFWFSIHFKAFNGICKFNRF